METFCSNKCLFLSLTLLLMLWMAWILNQHFSPKNLEPFKIPYPPPKCWSPKNLTEPRITPIKDTKHFIVSAYRDHRIHGMTRIIGIIKRDDIKQLHCIFWCRRCGYFVAEAEVDIHSDHFGFPYQTTDLLCKTEPMCDATHITISSSQKISGTPDETFLAIQNREIQEDNFKYNFTVCISTLFGQYNNVLQFIQTIEVYKILGIQRVVIYNTSCGPDLEKVLQYYKDEGTLEIHQWPIDQFLNPSKGWNFQEHKGDIHYYGQLTTLNDCIYRNMYRSKYLLLNDIDEIIMPYQHATLGLLLEDLQRQNHKVAVFLIKNHSFPKTGFNEEFKFHFRRWTNVPGINILDYIYHLPDNENVFNPTKIIINPRQVVQTSVHSVLKNYGQSLTVSPDVCNIVHVKSHNQNSLRKELLIVDKKLWEHEKDLVPNIDNVLNKSGIYS